jgi:site-specific DNA-adenine methylase
MRYFGGKNRTGKQFAEEIINVINYDDNEAPLDNYVEPFCGACGVLQHMIPTLEENSIKAWASDGCPDLSI